MFDKHCLETAEMQSEGPYSAFRLKKSIVLTNKVSVEVKFDTKNVKVS